MTQWKTQLLVNNWERLMSREDLSRRLRITTIVCHCTDSFVRNIEKVRSRLTKIKNISEAIPFLCTDELKLCGKTPPEIELLLNTISICSQNTAMDLGMGKCDTLAINQKKI